VVAVNFTEPELADISQIILTEAYAGSRIATGFCYKNEEAIATSLAASILSMWLDHAWCADDN
jgi:hypothetical protein